MSGHWMVYNLIHNTDNNQNNLTSYAGASAVDQRSLLWDTTAAYSTHLGGAKLHKKTQWGGFSLSLVSIRQ